MNPKDRRNPIRKLLTRVVLLLNHLPGADRIEVRQHTVTSPRVPQAFDGLTIVQVSDLHGRWFGRGQKRLLQKVKQQKPDLILVTGDWIDVDYEKNDVRCCRAAVKGLKAIAPVYGIIGNHEARADHKSELLSDLQRRGVRLLLDQSVKLTRGGQSIVLTGLQTPYDAPLKENGEVPELLEEQYRGALRGTSEEQFRIVMGHRPELFELYGKLGVDLVLSGHAHGGLMKLPGGRRLLAPGQGWLPQYTHGCYRKGKTCMIVSCGLGGPRIGIVPEIGRIVLKTEK